MALQIEKISVNNMINATTLDSTGTINALHPLVVQICCSYTPTGAPHLA
jgi:hypothetical protein